MLSKRPVLRFTAALFFLLKLFSSHIYCIPKYNKIIFKGGELVDNAARSSLDDAQRALLLLMSFVCRKFLLHQIESSLYSPYYAEACNELRGPSPSLLPGQLRSEETWQRWRVVGNTESDLTARVIEPQISCTNSVRLTTEPTSRLWTG